MSKSYQFAPSTLPGWNDCPAQVNYTPNQKRLPSKTKRINHICHLDSLNDQEKPPTKKMVTPPPKLREPNH